MYSNSNSRWQGQFEVAGGEITANTTTEFDLSVPGLNPDTTMVTAVMFASEADLAKTGAAQPMIRAYVKEAGVVTVAVTALVNTVTVASGAKVRIEVANNINQWDISGF